MNFRISLGPVVVWAFVLTAAAHAGDPIGTVYVTVDVENRVVRETFGGDDEAARSYFQGIYDELGSILLRDVNVALEVTEIVLWPETAPFELSPIDAGGATTTDRYNSYRMWVVANRRAGFLNMNHLWGVIGIESVSGLGLGGVNAYCNYGTAFIQVLDGQDNFLSVYGAGRYLGLGLGASSTMDDTFLGPLVTNDTMLAYGTTSASEIQATVTTDPAPCDPAVPLQCNRITSAGQIPYADNQLTMDAYLSEPASGPVSDNFAALTGRVESIRWWGILTGTCPPNPTFQVSVTGDAVGQWSLQPTVRDTGILFSGSPGDASGRSVQQFDAPLPNPILTTGGTISIANEDNDCTFYWLDSPIPTTKAALPAGVNASFCMFDKASNFAPLEELGCPDGHVFSQPCGAIDQSAERVISDADAGFTAFEHFEEIPGPITAISWWGVFLDDTEAPCTPSTANFSARFYEEGATPVNLEAYRSTTVSVDTIPSSTLGPVARFTMPIFPPVDLASGWVSLQTTGNLGCDFYWLGARAGDNLAASATGANTPATFEGDLAFCIDADIPFSAHSADTDEDAEFSLSELLRVVQLYNAGAFGCDANTEDGYTLSTADSTCGPHDSDYNPQSWSVTLGELLRLVQLFNQGPYENCVSEDGFCPVP